MTIAAASPVQSRLGPPAIAAGPTSHAARWNSLKTKASASAVVDIRTHISNIDRVLQKPAAPSVFPSSNTSTAYEDAAGDASKISAARTTGVRWFDSLKISKLFGSAAATTEENYSPRSLAHLHRLLSDSPRPSPKSSIASRWRTIHGADGWSGLLDPLDENLRRELVRYGDLVQAAYHAFYANPNSSSSSTPPTVALPDRSYRVTRSLFATSSVAVPHWLAAASAAATAPTWMTQQSSFIGFVAVCDNEREIARMGRRDIVVALRGTATAPEWVDNFRSSLHPISAGEKVSTGFWSLYKTPGGSTPDAPASLSSAVVDEVRRLVEKYRGEELSITITGHSLGGALALLAADELVEEIADAPPIAVVTFGGPRVGNRGFAERVEGKGVKVLRVVNAHDFVTRVPGVLPGSGGGDDDGWWGSHLLEGYAHVGTELRVDNRASPYLRPDADPAFCHDLEAYLHLVDGFNGSGLPFRANAKRSLARLMSQVRPNMKAIYVSRSRSGRFDPVERARGVHQGCLASPSG
ncbi:Phospholipase A1-Ibeta2, chloroplastic [Apostasia shenzhenica]|uniref:Phospholipase A1-Ibeta2, chloroplastic n=1 Tax=Apostasia shenzhenica TaxID=1088818 RepID=A0A2I0ACQ9_9ASPA|nr:Phospholipase A1-Ibeta2, chloroplastic [Apostasia shenzhenica]